MRRIKGLPRLIIFAVLCAMLFSPTLTGRAQQPPTITATGTFGDGVPLTITFPPAGGAVTGNSFSQGEMEGTVVTLTFTMTGTFAGGDGGAASGTWVSMLGDGDPDSNSCTTWRGSWNGNFYANGTGSGIIDTETIHVPGYEVMESKIDDDPWQVTFSAAEFQAALSGPITSEYIFKTYGIRVEDSFGGDGYDQTAWSDHELSLLNDVLREIPPDLLKNMALTSIIRNKVKIDENGNQKPNVMGTYYACGKLMGKADCSGSTAVIRIFDTASSPYDFTNDPNGDIEFKASILHELTHALQYHLLSVYKDPTNSPLVQNYMDATRPNTALEAGINQNGWAWYGKPTGWKLYGAPGNEPPTNYGKTDPLEDMSESAMMYVYDPQKLQASSPQRYNFIRDQIYGGVEYENGIQKKP